VQKKYTGRDDGQQRDAGGHLDRGAPLLLVLGVFLDHFFQFDIPDKRKKSLEEQMTYSR